MLLLKKHIGIYLNKKYMFRNECQYIKKHYNFSYIKKLTEFTKKLLIRQIVIPL